MTTSLHSNITWLGLVCLSRSHSHLAALCSSRVLLPKREYGHAFSWWDNHFKGNLSSVSCSPYECLLLYKFGVWLNLFSFSCIAVTLETGVLMSWVAKTPLLNSFLLIRLGSQVVVETALTCTLKRFSD